MTFINLLKSQNYFLKNYKSLMTYLSHKTISSKTLKTYLSHKTISSKTIKTS